MFHIELRQRPHTARAFNLSEEELSRRFLAPLRAGQTLAYGDREWEPAKTKLTIYEGRELGPEEIGLGRGWQNVARSGTEVTERMLGTAPAHRMPAGAFIARYQYTRPSASGTTPASRPRPQVIATSTSCSGRLTPRQAVTPL